MTTAPGSVTVVLDAADPASMAAFWSALVRRPAVPDDRGVRIGATATQVGLRFVEADPAAAPETREWLHLHVLADSDDDLTATIAQALALGGRHLDVGQLPDEPHVVLADPEGNPFCLIPHTSSFLAGCGRLAEVACDGLREVGTFWSAALGWPLVWDQDGETAIQAPAGGTKIAWGGPPVAPVPEVQSQRLDIESPASAKVIAALIAAGARDDGDGPGEVHVLREPGGGQLWASRGQG